MGTDYTPFHDSRPPEPKLELVEVSWRVRGPSGRVLECGIYRTDGGVEVRCGYGGDLLKSEMVSSVVVGQLLALEWRELVMDKSSFEELAIE